MVICFCVPSFCCVFEGVMFLPLPYFCEAVHYKTCRRVRLSSLYKLWFGLPLAGWVQCVQCFKIVVRVDALVHCFLIFLSEFVHVGKLWYDIWASGWALVLLCSGIWLLRCLGVWKSRLLSFSPFSVLLFSFINNLECFNLRSNLLCQFNLYLEGIWNWNEEGFFPLLFGNIFSVLCPSIDTFHANQAKIYRLYLQM